MKAEDRSSVIAAALIMIASFAMLAALPSIVLSVGAYSPWLAFAIGALLIGMFFLIFWLRARYQRARSR